MRYWQLPGLKCLLRHFSAPNPPSLSRMRSEGLFSWGVKAAVSFRLRKDSAVLIISTGIEFILRAYHFSGGGNKIQSMPP